MRLGIVVTLLLPFAASAESAPAPATAPTLDVSQPPKAVDLAAALAPSRNLRSYFETARLSRSAKLLRAGKCRAAMRDLQSAFESREIPEALRGQVAFAIGYCAFK